MKPENLTIKVCGIRQVLNREALESLPVDLFGFIFYPASPRFVGANDHKLMKDLSATRKNKAGVFVNENTENILDICGIMGLTHVQLHGDETPGQCEVIAGNGYKVIKAFRIDESFDFSRTKDYAGKADFFLFDTKATQPGGTGRKFNWRLLESYTGSTSFFLSGGIGPGDLEQVTGFGHPQLYGLDLNSGFEAEPGLKNVDKLKLFLENLNS